MERVPPPQGPPPSYAFVTKVYKRSLRPVIIAVTILAGFWTLFSGIGHFRNAPYFAEQGLTALNIVAIVLGALYMLLTAIEAFGLFAGATQKLWAARIFAWLSAFAFIATAGMGLVRVIIHFTQKDNILEACAKLADGSRVRVYTGFWGPIRYDTLSREDAEFWCRRSWDRGSWSEILSFIATSLLAALFASIAFGFYRQLLDPSSVQNAWRAPTTVRTEAYPSPYAPPYNAGGPMPYPTYGQYTPSHAPYSGYPAYGPPPGPPPAESKPPGYGYSETSDWLPPRDDKNPFESPQDGTAGGGSNQRP